MARIYIEDLAKHTGTEVTISGWIYNKRSSGKIRFLVIRDGTGILQCVMVKQNLSEERFFYVQTRCWSEGKRHDHFYFGVRLCRAS